MLQCHRYEGWGWSRSISSEIQPTKCTMMRHKSSEIVKSLGVCSVPGFGSKILYPQTSLSCNKTLPSAPSDFSRFSCSNLDITSALSFPYFHIWSMLLPASWNLTHYLDFQLWSYRTQIFKTQMTPSSVAFMQTLDWLEARGQQNSIYRPLEKIKIKNPISCQWLKNVCSFIRIKRISHIKYEKITPHSDTQVK